MQCIVSFQPSPPLTPTPPPPKSVIGKQTPKWSDATRYYLNMILDGSATFMSKIIDKVWPIKKKAPKVHIAYAISVCEFILNPKNKKIQISEFPIKHKISKYLNKLVNKE